MSVPRLLISLFSLFIWAALSLVAERGSAGETPDQAAAGQQPARSVPFFELRSHESRYVGPAGPRLRPEDVEDVPIGYFGPFDPEDPLYGRVWQAAERAVTQANAEGGFEGKPFRLVPAWSTDPWGTGVSQLARLVYRDQVWAIVGGVDGPSTHLAEQIVAKARVALVSPLSTDKTVNLANVPWMFSLAPGDHLIAPVLAEAIVQHLAVERLVVLTAKDHDSFLLAQELLKSLRDRQVHPRYKFIYDAAAAAEMQPLIEQCTAAQPEGVVIVADVMSTAQLVHRLRETGFAGWIVGGPAMGRDIFLEQAGALAGNVLFPLMVEPAAMGFLRLAPEREAAAVEPPPGSLADGHADFAALLTYDAVQLVVRAIRTAGLNRTDIKAALREHSPARGVTGRVEWDNLGTNTRPPAVATLRDGKVVPWTVATDP